MLNYSTLKDLKLSLIIFNKENRSFINILEKAYDEVGFNAQDCKVKIDAAVLHNGTFAITVTKLLKLKNVSKPVRPVKVAKKLLLFI